MWRELCWWYLVYRGRDGGGACDIVFAVEVRPRRPAVRSAVVPRADQPPQEDLPRAGPPAEGTPGGDGFARPRTAAGEGVSPAF
jgi:hypothetical protein